MEDRSSLFDLARQLLRCGESALLDCSLLQLSHRLQGEDERAAELLRDLLATGLAESLRDALEDDRLDRWVAETCTRREEESLCTLLMRWLGTSRHGDDDPARLVQLPALPALSHPDAAAQLHAWAAAHGVAELLFRRARELLPARPELDPDVSFEACCLGIDRHAQASPLAVEATRHEARALLLRRASELAAPAARAALWRRPLPELALRALVNRLHALLASGATALELARVHFIPARPVTVDPRTGTCEGMLLDAQAVSFAVQLHLSGYEHRAPAGQCAHCATRTSCIHIQALAARLLDGLYAHDDRLHAALQQVATQPSWQRFVSALRDTDGETQPAASSHEQLAFRVRVEGRALSVGVLQRKTLSGGGVSAGKLVAPQKASRSRACSERDRPLLDALSLAGGRTFAAQYISADLTILRALVEHPQVILEAGEQTLRVAEQNLHVELIEQPEGLLPRVSLAGVRVPAGQQGTRGFLFRHDIQLQTLWFAPLTPPLRRLLGALDHFHGLLPPESFSAVASWLAEVRQVARVTVPAALQGEELPASRKLLLRITPGRDEGIDVVLSSRPLPLGALWPPGQGSPVARGLIEGRQVFTRRDLDLERVLALQVLEQLRLHEHMCVQPFSYVIETRQAALQLLASAAELTERLDLEWAEPTRQLTLTTSLRVKSLSIRVFKRSQQWLAMEGAAQSDDAFIALDRLLEAARRGERFVRVGEGSYAELSDELFQRLDRAQLCLVDLKPGAAVAVPTAAVAYWQAALGERTEPASPEVHAWLSRAVNHDPNQVSELDPRWQSILRDYQVAGAHWLLQMSSWAPGACLADEMGLGKTVQAIVLLHARAALGPALVLAPTSVVSNWTVELARFAPELDVRTYRGAARERALHELGAGCVLVTSYELLLRDRARFRDVRFATQVLDEAHLIKNARTARARAAIAVHAEFRLAMSGTPVENRLGDLWSVFHAVAPGLLGNWGHFRAIFAVPIERYANAERAEALRTLVAPFILRRTKRDVAHELPERTEVVHRVALSEPERLLYRAAEREVRIALQKRGPTETRAVQMLAELTRLRLLACHPRLVLQQPEAESTKLAVLLSLLDDILPRGHRALLFSQFTRHLALVREALDARGLQYLYLDGATPAAARGGLVERFQAGEAPLFLISLKAGGTGLNLTAADYVVHLDPWWNPAAEDQASDRAHRLGQRRPVTIIRLVAEDTIEEKVLALHKHKRELADAVIHGSLAPATLDLAALEGLLP